MIVGAVSGGFDPPHDKHTEYFEEALVHCDELLVILTRDDQLVKKKGKVWMPYERRKYMLDWMFKGKYKPCTVVQNVDTDIASCESLRRYRPDVFLKGGSDWNEENLRERDVCKELGIRVIFGVGGYDKPRGSSDVKDDEREEFG